MISFKHLYGTHFLPYTASFIFNNNTIRLNRILDFNVLVGNCGLNGIVVEILENGESLVVHNNTMRNARLIFELLQVIHYNIYILLYYNASLVSPRLRGKFNGFNSHSIFFLFFNFYCAWTFLNVAWLNN